MKFIKVSFTFGTQDEIYLPVSKPESKVANRGV